MLMNWIGNMCSETALISTKYLRGQWVKIAKVIIGRNLMIMYLFVFGEADIVFDDNLVLAPRHL